MTKQDHAKYLRIALAMQGITVNDRTADQIIETYWEIMEKGDDFSLKDACAVDAAMEEKYNKDVE